MKKARSFLILFVISLLVPFASTEALEDQHELDIILVLDNSGSMKKNDPEFLAKDVVTKSLITMGNGSRLGMVLFDEKVTMAVKLMETGSSSARSRILEGLEQIDYKGQFTNIPAGIERAVYELKSNGRANAEKIIILLTDGIVDVGDKQKDAALDQWLKEGLAQDSKKAGIRIIGVAFTEAADFSLIQTLANKTDGEYFRAYNAEDISGIFEKIKKLITLKDSEPETIEQPQEVFVPVPVPGKAKELPKPEIIVVQPSLPTGVKTPVQETAQPDTSLIFLFVVILVLIVITALIVVFYVKSRTEGIKDAVDGDPEMPVADLIDLKNVTSQKVIRLDRRSSRIGRDPNNDIVMPGDLVSSLHATIDYRGGFFYIEDQRSKNGTSLNGKELSPNVPIRLKSGDDIKIDGYIFKFVLPDMIQTGETVIDFTSGGKTQFRTVPEQTRTSGQGELPDLPQAILVDVKNTTGEKTIRLEKGVTKIGRDVNNDVTIPLKTISSLHATIEYRDNFFFLEDQRSRNTTSLGGERLEPNSPRKLKSGDEILFDISKFIFLLEYQLPSGETGDRTEVW